MSQSLISPETGSLAVGNLEERLRAHPHLCERIEALLNVVENSALDVETADLAEDNGSIIYSSEIFLQHLNLNRTKLF